MIDHVVPRMACSCAILAIAFAHCGCQSMKGPSSWMASGSKPRQSNNKEIVTYWGQKKDKGKAPNTEELRSRMANAKDGASSFDSHMRLGNSALRANQLGDAKKEYEKALALRPNDPDCHHRLAVVADKQGQFGAADDHYEAAMKQRPNDANLLSDLGYSYSLRGEERRAEDTLNRALAIKPSHKGAMANLGSIYAKQDRYDEAMAMFRRGASEAEAQQYLAQLFPQRSAMQNNEMFAQNAPSNRVSPMNNERPDLANMTPEQLREAMNREKAESKARRQQQMIEESKPRAEWYDQGPSQPMAQNNSPSSQSSNPIVLGPGSGQPSQPQFNQPQLNQQPPNQYPVVTPNGYGNNNPGSMASTGNPNGFGPNANQLNNQDGFNARPGTTPDIGDWQGAGVRDPNFQRAGQANANPNPQVTNPYYQQPANQFGQPVPNGMPMPNGQPMGFAQNAGGLGDQSANQAAAQLGMNVGGLFPVVPAEAGNGGFGQPNNPGSPMDSRLGNEFSAPPSYQDPSYTRNRNAFAPGDQRQGSFQPQMDNEPLGPQSPASGWPQIHGNNNQVVQAGATSPSSNSVPRFADPSTRGPAESTWADKPSLSPAAPFNGSWPPGAQNGGTGTPNSLPNWNNGQGASRQPTRPSTPSTTAGNEIEPWPYRKQ